MTDSGRAAEREPGEADRDRDDPPEFEEGRYCYCIVDVSDDEPTEFSETGIEDEPVYVVAVDDVGVVVHERDEMYDTSDVAQVRRWLLAHQRVVDAAGERFGTPLPFGFDTIVTGDDDAVEEWVRSEYDHLSEYLADFAGHWEYRVQLVWADGFGEDAIEADDELRQLRQRRDEASEGTAFLVEKQYERRVEQVRRAHREEIEDDLVERLTPLVREIEPLDGPRASIAGVESTSDDGPRYSMLAREDREAEIGDELDEIAAIDGVEVRYTGPWPPYTFAPELGDAP